MHAGGGRKADAGGTGKGTGDHGKAYAGVRYGGYAKVHGTGEMNGGKEA